MSETLTQMTTTAPAAITPEATEPTEQSLMARSLEELEFHKVLERVAEFATSDLGTERIIAAFPTPDTAWLRAEHERVEEMLKLLNTGERLPLEGLSDVRTLLRKAQISGALLLPAELLHVRDMMRTSRMLRAFVNTRSELAPTLAVFCTPLHENRLLEKHIGDAVDDVGNVKDSASTELARIRRDILDTANRLRQRLNKILKKIAEEDLVQEEFITQRDGRFVLPMKVEYKRFIPGIIHGMSGSGSTVFLEPAETFEMNNDLALLHSEERREIERILTTLTAEIAQEVPEFLRSVEILAHVDALYAKARYAREYDCFKPAIVDEPHISLHNIYHPVLVQSKGKRHVVPLSIEFDGSTSPESTLSVFGHLISGPNAGGKTVALKSIGLNVALALAGMFPCGVCRTNYRAIFSAIGDQQSLENDVSTFSSQLLRLREILTHAMDNALVLVDEICSGTDPQEGAALAVGIMEGLLARKAFFVVTTHQSSLKSYALTKSGISNASMEFNSEKLQSTYKFLSGVPGNSYAFVLARTLGLPPKVMERAQEYLGDKHSTLEQSIEVIQQYRRDAERMRRESEDLNIRAEKKKAEYEARFAEFKTKYNELIRLAKQEAADIVSQANKVVENTIRELREASKEAEFIREIHERVVAEQRRAAEQPAAPAPKNQQPTTKSHQPRTLTDIKKAFDQQKQAIHQANTAAQASKASPPPQEEPVELSEGDAVLMDDVQTPGVIIALDRASNSAVVEFDAVKFRTTLDKLTRASTKQVKNAAKGKSSAVEVNFNAETRLDLRGMYSDEALQVVEKSIAAALTGNVHTLTIVHGKGTGALRQAIQNHLANHPAVERYRNGLLTEGGAGVTVVDLK